MKKILLAFLISLLSILSYSQTVVFYDGFENGTSNWTLTGDWGLTTNSFLGVYALTESPLGNYPDQSTMIATMDTAIDLTAVQDAEVAFTAAYSIEFGFDFMFFDASLDGGINWINIESYTGDSVWWRYVYPLGGFVGSSEVMCRFRFVSDDLLNYDGMQIDEFNITTYADDNTPPLIVHSPLPHYEATLFAYDVNAEIVDISGVISANLNYWVDNIPQSPITGINYSGNSWLFQIPAQTPGSWIEYTMTAIDSSINFNSVTTDIYEVILGNYIKYDNGIVDYMNTIGLGNNTSAAVLIDIGGTTDLVTALIRNYTDPTHPNADMEFHVWANDSGTPGADMIVPIIVTPEASAAFPHRITRIDLRPYSDSLAGITGDVFIGFIATSGNVHLVQSTPTQGNHTYTESFGNWNLINDDYHFRAITSEITGAPIANFSFDTINDPQVAFTDLTTNTPTSWYWDFDDNGAFSTDQNPAYAFQISGTHNVCLTATNGISTSTVCNMVTIQNITSPIANFYFITDYSPQILFVDTSIGYPTTWHWDFDDNGATFNYLNPMYIFSQNDTFNVCLTVTNLMGSDTFCQEVIIDSYVAPEAEFSFDPAISPTIQFYDESSTMLYNTADTWQWDFDDNGATSTAQNPLYLFSGNGIYNVCLTASNPYGSDTYCNQVIITTFLPPTADFNFDTIATPEVYFYDTSSDSVINSPDAWLWDFGDGTTSNLQNPNHIYAENGIYEVCLVVSNAEGSDTICNTIEISVYAIPVAEFTFNSITDPIVFFIDQSTGVPTDWHWNFNDNGAIAITQNPSQTFSTNDTFNVCLTATNYLGSDTWCNQIIISSYLPPIADFSYIIDNDSIVSFIDESVNNPTEWIWEFNYNGETSTIENPTFIFSENGTYHVCLVATNVIGSSSPYCEDIEIAHIGITEEKELSNIKVYPQPMTEYSVIEYSTTEFNSIPLLKLYNILGEQIKIRTNYSDNSITIFKDNIITGVYFIELIDDNLKLTRFKIVIE